MSVEIVQVDAFTSRPFAGNPAAVCLLDTPRDETWLRLVAREMNLSETAFLWHQEGEHYHLRWFTPAAEVDLCGHATLASAHMLWEQGRAASHATLHFHTRSGLLSATRDGAWITLDFPATPAAPAAPPPDLLRALGDVVPTFVGRSTFDYLVELESEAIVRELQPDSSLLKRVAARGIILTSRADAPEYQFVSRFFAPAIGIDEDPVTGSAHCCLAPHWCEQLGHDTLVGHQASTRGGRVRVTLRAAEQRVLLAGQAVTVLRAVLLA